MSNTTTTTDQVVVVRVAVKVRGVENGPTFTRTIVGRSNGPDALIAAWEAANPALSAYGLIGYNTLADDQDFVEVNL